MKNREIMENLIKILAYFTAFTIKNKKSSIRTAGLTMFIFILLYDYLIFVKLTIIIMCLMLMFFSLFLLLGLVIGFDELGEWIESKSDPK